MINFCSYLDKNYLSRFLALEKSINRFNFKYTFYVLCLDDFVFKFFKENLFSNIKMFHLKKIEKKYKALASAKKNRELIEYYFTLTPFLPKYINTTYKTSKLIYLDSDFYFLSNPKKIIKNDNNYSVAITKQNSNPKYGKYNIGWINYNFKFEETKKILDQWSQQCLTLCKDFAVNNTYADQKYLDSWPGLLKYIKINEPEQTCLSPWDHNFIIEKKLRKIPAYHFHGLEISNSHFISGFSKYNKIISSKILNIIYIPYIKEILFFEKKYNLVSGSIRNVAKNKIFKFFIFFRLIKFIFKITFYRDKYNLDLINKF